MYSLAFKNLGITAEEAAKAFQEFAKVIPPFTEEDILAVHMNSSSLLKPSRPYILLSMTVELRLK